VRMRSKEEHVAELEKTEYRSRPINIQNKQKGILVLFGKTRVKKASEKVRKSPGHIAIVVAILTEEGRAGDDAKLSRARNGEEIERAKNKRHTRETRETSSEPLPRLEPSLVSTSGAGSEPVLSTHRTWLSDSEPGDLRLGLWLCCFRVWRFVNSASGYL
jgi:hypothetical protein